jgi:hypothetical protein
VYRVIEPLVEDDSVKITYYLSRIEFENILTMAKYLYDIKAIPRPTAGTYSRAAALKMYKELDNLLAKEKEEADLKAQ